MMKRRNFLKGALSLAAGAAIAARTAAAVEATTAAIPPAETAIPAWVDSGDITVDPQWTEYGGAFAGSIVTLPFPRPRAVKEVTNFDSPPFSREFVAGSTINGSSLSDVFARMAREPTVDYRINNGPRFAGRIIEFGPFKEGEIHGTFELSDGDAKE